MARVLLPAPVDPMVALWVCGRHGDEMQRVAELYASRGMPDVARQFLMSLARLQTAAAQLSNEAVAASVVVSGNGSGEAETAADLEGSRQEISTAEAARRLDRTRERVCQLLKAGDLVGRKAGNAWWVQAASVDDLLERRRAA